MRNLAVMLILLISVNLFAPTKIINQEEELNKIYYNLDQKVLDYNIIALEDNSIRTREEVFKLAQPMIEILIKRKNYHMNFPNMDSLSYAITCIFISESSNSKGQSARSNLWLIHKNPFGLTFSQGVTKMSWEMIKGKRVNMYRTFRSFNNFEETIDCLFKDYLWKSRYDLVRNSYSVEEFLHNLYKCGWMTNRHWPKFAFNEIYLKNV